MYTVQLDIQHSQGSAATNLSILAYVLLHLPVQLISDYNTERIFKIASYSIFAKVIVKLKVARFYGSWCIYEYWEYSILFLLGSVYRSHSLTVPPA